MGKTMKKLVLLFAVVIISVMFAITANATVYNGECGAEGDNVTWTLDSETGILEINGSGAIKDYTSNNRSPWSGNSTIKHIIINDGITKIGEWAFWNCCWVESTINLPDSVTEISAYAFLECRKLPGIIIPDSVEKIGKRAFSYCEVLSNVVLPKGLKSISDELFYSCTWTNSITIPVSVTEIGARAFSCCRNIKNITIPEGVVSIGDNAFAACENLTNIDIPNSVKSIGEYAFAGCKIKNIFIPAGVEYIGIAPLNNCDNLEEIIVDENNNYLFSDEHGVLYDKRMKILIQFPKNSEITSYEVLDKIQFIGKASFNECEKLQKIVLPETVKEIGDYAFSYCRNLKNINLSDELTTIGKGAFSACSMLQEVYLSDNIESIGYSAFSGCKTLKSISFPNKITKIESNLYSGCSNITDLVIPSHITEIGNSAFSGCTALDNLTISKSVEKIGSSAFYNCTKLKNVILDKNLKVIGDRAFQYNSVGINCLIKIDNLYYDGTLEDWHKIQLVPSDSGFFSGVTPPGPMIKNLYINGELLENLVIPDSFTEIKNYAFYGIECIKTIIIPNTIKRIGTNAFENTNPEKVIYRGTHEEWCNISFAGGIGQYHSYLGCNPVKSSTELYIEGKKIRNLEIPSGVEKIQNMAFYDNDKITNVFIPKSVKKIYGCAFYDCNNLGDVYYEGSEEEWKKISISQYNDSLTNATIHYNSSPDDFGYNIRVTTVGMPSMTIKEGKKTTAIAQLYLNGEVVNDDVEFTVASSNPNVLSIENLSVEDSALTFELNAIKPGVSQVTVLETLTETGTATEIEVVTGNLIFNSQYLPTHYEREQEYNCYSSGLYISDFKCGLIDDEYKVTFNAWNAMNVMGVVCVYDADGVIKSVTPIKRFEGNMATSIKDALYNGYKVIDDWVWGELGTFKQDSLTKKTEIEVYVPEGGYIEITNNPMNNDYCATLNYVGFIFEFANAVGGTYMDMMTHEGVTEKFSYTILEELMKTSPELLKNFSEKLAKKTLKNFSIHTINDVLIETAEDGLSILNDGGVDILKIIEDTGESFIIGTAEKVFMKSSGCLGFVMNGLFKYSEFINTTSWFIDLLSQRTEDSIKIWTFDKDGNFCDNGVKGNNVDNEIDLGAQNMVMRSVIISKEDKTEINFDEVFEKIADEYIVRDIYFQCNGDIMQPGQRIQISIPVPKEFDPELCAIFWVRDDGTVEKMDAEYSNGYMQFIATHFSYYAIVQYHVHTYSEVVVSATCTEAGSITYTCTCGDTYTETIPATGHTFDGSECTNCDYDKADECDCNCHASGIKKFFFKLILFFQKLFKKNPVCACGVAHY